VTPRETPVIAPSPAAAEPAKTRPDCRPGRRGRRLISTQITEELSLENKEIRILECLGCLPPLLPLPPLPADVTQFRKLLKAQKYFYIYYPNKLLPLAPTDTTSGKGPTMHVKLNLKRTLRTDQSGELHRIYYLYTYWARRRHQRIAYATTLPLIC